MSDSYSDSDLSCDERSTNSDSTKSDSTNQIEIDRKKITRLAFDYVFSLADDCKTKRDQPKDGKFSVSFQHQGSPAHMLFFYGKLEKFKEIPEEFVSNKILILIAEDFSSSVITNIKSKSEWSFMRFKELLFESNPNITYTKYQGILNSNYEYPKIYLNDPIARRHRFKEGDVVQIDKEIFGKTRKDIKIVIKKV